MEERLKWLLEEKYENVVNKTVLIIGVGGVGSYALESLTRTGIKNLIIVDFDKIDITNINRQIMTLHSNVGLDKVDVWEQRIKEINSNCNVIKIKEFITKDNLNLIFNYDIDYVIDACDTIETKKEIILYCLRNKIKFISSMGMANRLDSSLITKTYLNKTFNDPLAKKLRLLLKDTNKKIPVVFSSELPKKDKKLGSIAHVVGTAGLLLSNFVINDIVKGCYEKNN